MVTIFVFANGIGQLDVKRLLYSKNFYSRGESLI